MASLIDFFVRIELVHSMFILSVHYFNELLIHSNGKWILGVNWLKETKYFNERLLDAAPVKRLRNLNVR